LGDWGVISKEGQFTGRARKKPTTHLKELKHDILIPDNEMPVKGGNLRNQYEGEGNHTSQGRGKSNIQQPDGRERTRGQGAEK